MAVAAISPAAMVARIGLVFIFCIPALIFLPILGLQTRSWQSIGGQAMNRRFILLALLAAILVAVAVLVLAPGSKQATEAPPLAGATIGGPFSLVDQDGRSVTQDALKGRYALVDRKSTRLNFSH